MRRRKRRIAHTLEFRRLHRISRLDCAPSISLPTTAKWEIRRWFCGRAVFIDQRIGHGGLARGWPLPIDGGPEVLGR